MEQLQGYCLESSLDPLLFYTSINDIIHVIHSNKFLFGDGEDGPIT